MTEHGERLVDSGYPIIPIMPGTKAPGQYRSGRWQGYLDWSRHCDRPTRAFEVDIWKRWPGCGVGIAAGSIVGFDIDVLDNEIVERIERKARADLGDTPAVRIGRAPKKLLVYRSVRPFQKIARHPIEILAHGSQFVAYATHPETREPYHWPIDELSELPLSALPVVTEEQCRRFLDAAFQVIPPALRRSTLGPDRSAEHYHAAGGELRGTLRAVTSALELIPNDDLHYDDWIRIGMALKGALGDQGSALFAVWSARSAKDVPAATARAWNSLKPQKIGAGSIYYYATEHGWTPEPDMILNGAVEDAVQAAPHPAEALLGKAHARANGQEPHAESEADPETGKSDPIADVSGTPVPEEIMNVGGVLGSMADWMAGTAIYPQPFLALAASIAAVGTAAGRRYAGPGDIRTNIYCVGIADSGSGKEHQLNCLSNLFGAADLLEYFAGEEIASGTAIESTMARHAVQLFMVDEIGHFMAAVFNPRATSSHKRDILVKLTKYTGSANRLVKGTEYANKKERERVDVQEPCVCIYGTTIPEALWKAFASGALNDGSIARILFFQTPNNYPDWCDQKSRLAEIPGEVIAGLRSIVAGVAAESGFGFSAAKAMALDGRTRPDLIRVDFADDSADSLARELLGTQVCLKRRHEGHGHAAIWARWYEHVLRLALISAISRAPTAPAIMAGDLVWARILVDHCIGTLLTAAERHIADTEHEAVTKRVLGIIRRFGGWMDGHEVANRIRFISRRARMELIAELVEAGLLEARKETIGKKPRILVRVAGESV